MTLAALISFSLGGLLFLVAGYLGLLALLAAKMKAPAHVATPLRFAIVIPAHNEETQVGATVQSARSVDYPENRRRVIVIADNCSDGTAQIARQAGAEVLERFDNTRRGKGYALELAFETLLNSEPRLDAVVVVDADSVVSTNLLSALAARLARGEVAVQAEYGVRNPRAAWRTKLMAVALGMFHQTRSLARERLRLSVGLRGNGMCFSMDLLRRIPHQAYGLVEDVEYGLKIAFAGHRVAYAPEAQVLGDMVSSSEASVSQRRRWEQGRWALARQQIPTLVREGLRRRSLMLLDLAMDLLVPPLSYVGIAVLLGLTFEASLWLISGSATAGMALWMMSVACLGLYLLRGVQHSGLGWHGFWALAYAPIYVLWKIMIARPFAMRREQEWIRTRREINR